MPPIAIPHDWRSAVAALPHARWVAWRRRSRELQAALGRVQTGLDIRECDRRAAVEAGIVEAETAAVQPVIIAPRSEPTP